MTDQDVESFRVLRTNLAFLDVDRTITSVLVASPLPEDGKSTVAASLAAAGAPSTVAGKLAVIAAGSHSVRPDELLNIRADQTTRDEARAVKDALAHLPERTTGIVVTGLKPGREHDYGYYSHEYYGER